MDNKTSRSKKPRKRTVNRDRGVSSFCEVPNFSFEYRVLVTSYFSEVPLSHYQNHLMSMIFKLHEEGWDTGQISRYLSEKGYLSVRGKALHSQHIWSMLKKIGVRIERNSKEPTVVLESLSVTSDKTK